MNTTPHTLLGPDDRQPLQTESLSSFWGIESEGPTDERDRLFRSLLLDKDREQSGTIRNWLHKTYYALKPLIPRGCQLYLRRRLAHRILRRSSARWPIDRAGWRLACQWLDDTIKSHPRPLHGLSFWPGAASCAVVLTHDVEQSDGFKRIDKVARIEEDLGYRSSWNIVPERYPVDIGMLRSLTQRGHEVGVHGLHHDGKLFSSREVFRKRVESIATYAKTWGARGFRSPATLRNADWMQELPFDYDASFFDTDPFEPQPGGCAHVFPYMLGKLVELPYTLPQDHTLFELLRCDALNVWLMKADWIRSIGGMVLVLTHPDYMVNDSRIAVYRHLLLHFRAWDRTWHTLPYQVADWWKRRNGSYAAIDKAQRVFVNGPAKEALPHQYEASPRH